MDIDIDWTFGFSKNIQCIVHDLSDENRKAIFYASSQFGVIYDFNERKQLILQGHCHNISCCCVSSDKKWIVTADEGPNSAVLVWDAISGVPVKSIYAAHSCGVTSIDISGDSLYLVTIGVEKDIAIWAWTQASENVVVRCNVIDSMLDESMIRFDQTNNSNIVSWGPASITFWRLEISSLVGYTIPKSKFETGNNIGSFTTTTFSKKNCALTCTSEGFVIFFSRTLNVTSSSDVQNMKAMKVLKLTDSGINVSCYIANYFVIGCRDGSIRFYDDSFRLEAWFEDLNAGSINSISFSTEIKSPSTSKFSCPNFIVSTEESFIVKLNSSMFNQVLIEDRRGILLLQGLTSRVTKISCHCSKPVLAICCDNSTLQLWSYDLGLLINVRDFGYSQRSNNMGSTSLVSGTFPSSLKFQSSGNMLAIGFSNGAVKIIDGTTLEDISTFMPSSNLISGLCFSKDSLYLSCFDNEGYVMLFKRSILNTISLTQEADLQSYDYFGRIRSHSDLITGLSFGTQEKVEVLISVGRDGMYIGYDLSLSSVENGIVLANLMQPSSTLDIANYPTSLCWYPSLDGEIEDRFVVSFNNYKAREFNAESKRPRRTVNMTSPETGAINQMVPVHRKNRSPMIAFSTDNHTIGLCSLPLSGNPNHRIAIAAHPVEVTDIAVSFDGKYLFSAGGSDLSVNKWRYNDKNDFLLKDDVLDYYELLDGGNTGKVYNDIVDYFYYCQVRAQGESSMNKLNINGNIPLSEIPNLMRALGFYPSEIEIENMTNEVRYKDFLVNGTMQTEVSLDEVIKLYINYKPVCELSTTHIIEAFEKTKGYLCKSGIEWADLQHLLTSLGEVISAEDLHLLLDSLKEKDRNQTKSDDISPQRFLEMLE